MTSHPTTADLALPLDAAARKLITPALMGTIREHFELDWRGDHGPSHWARVRYHGVALARALDADVRVATLFSVVHDSQRQNECDDPDHGERAAEFAGWLHRRGLLDLDVMGLKLLQAACAGHSDGQMEADLTVQVCWDSDRLDLGRVGIYPDARRLCTALAQEPRVIERAWQWANAGLAPAPDTYASGPVRARGMRR